MPLLHAVRQIAIRRGDHLNVDGHRLRAADGHDLRTVERAKKRGLQIERHVADFVEEQDARMRLDEFAGLAAGAGAGETARHIAEKLARNKLVRDRGAIDEHEGATFADPSA